MNELTPRIANGIVNWSEISRLRTVLRDEITHAIDTAHDEMIRCDITLSDPTSAREKVMADIGRYAIEELKKAIDWINDKLYDKLYEELHGVYDDDPVVASREILEEFLADYLHKGQSAYMILAAGGSFNQYHSLPTPEQVLANLSRKS